MGKTGKWLKGLLVGKKEDKEKKEKDKGGNQASALSGETRSAQSSTPSKEKRRWSFRRTAGKELTSAEVQVSAPLNGVSEANMDQKRHAMAVVAATAAAADAAVAAAQAAAAVMRLTGKATGRFPAEEAAAVKIQTAFRGYLARKALCALRGLVKLQALVRGHLVRTQASATLRCMQALVTAQERARIQRIRMLEEAQATPQRQPDPRRSPQHPRHRQSYDTDRTAEENIKIVEMDFGQPRSTPKGRSSYSTPQTERTNRRYSSYIGNRSNGKLDGHQVSPSPSALTDISPRAYSGHFEEFFSTVQSSPHYLSTASVPEPRKSSFHLPRQEMSYSMSHDYSLYPNYMANTESSRAKARSQSAPKQRPDSWERPPSRRKYSLEGRNIPRSGRMQRSSSQVGATAHTYQYPWSLKLDRSSMSLKDSDCGSTSTVQTTKTGYRSLAAYEVHGYR